MFHVYIGYMYRQQKVILLHGITTENNFTERLFLLQPTVTVPSIETLKLHCSLSAEKLFIVPSGINCSKFLMSVTKAKNSSALHDTFPGLLSKYDKLLIYKLY